MSHYDDYYEEKATEDRQRYVFDGGEHTKYPQTDENSQCRNSKQFHDEWEEWSKTVDSDQLTPVRDDVLQLIIQKLLKKPLHEILIFLEGDK